MTERIKSKPFVNTPADRPKDRRQRRKLRRRVLYRDNADPPIQIQETNTENSSRLSNEQDSGNLSREPNPPDQGNHIDENGMFSPPPGLYDENRYARGECNLAFQKEAYLVDPPCQMLVVSHDEAIRTDFDILPWPKSTLSSSSGRRSSVGGEELIYQESVRQYKSIDQQKLTQLAQKLKGTGNCEVLRGMMQIGASNIIIFLAFDDEAATRWVARFPTIGPAGLTPDYAMLAELIESMVATMGYVSAHTNLPVPTIHHWSSGCDNELGRPYVIMDAAKGNCLYDLENAGFDLDEVVDKLSSFVDQWAQCIAELATLQFETIGSLAPESEGHLGVGPLLNYCNIRYSPKLEEDVFRGPFNSVADLLLTGSHLMREAFRSASSNSPLTHQKFLHSKLIDSLFPFYVDQTLLNGPFVLSHVDFDLQNILVDETNNFKITGIVDWDLAAVVPLQSHLRVPEILMCDRWTKTRQTNRAINPWQLKFAQKYRDHFKWCLIKHLREKGLDYPAGNLLESGYMFGRFQRAMSEEPQDDIFDEIWSNVYGTELNWKDVLKGMQTADWGTVMAEKLSLPMPTETEPEPEERVVDTRSDAVPSRPETTDTFWNHFKKATWRARIANKMRWGWWHIERCILCQMGSNRISFLNRRGFSELSAKHGAGRSFERGEKVASGGTGKGNGIGVEELKNQEEMKSA